MLCSWPRRACRLRCRAVGTRWQHFSFVFQRGPKGEKAKVGDQSCLDSCRFPIQTGAGAEGMFVIGLRSSLPNFALETPKGVLHEGDSGGCELAGPRSQRWD